MRQLKQIFEPCRRMFEEMGGGQLTSQCFWKAKKNTKNTKTLFLGVGAVNYSRILFLSREGVLEPNTREKQGLSALQKDRGNVSERYLSAGRARVCVRARACVLGGGWVWN